MFSIILPTYNRSELLLRAVRSVVNQTYQDWELIIIDDGSTDNTENIVRDNFSKDNRIIYSKKKNSGAPDSRNHGVNLATRKYLAFLDSDDTWQPTKLEKVEEKLNSTKEDVCVYSGFRTINSKTMEVIREVKPTAGIKDLHYQLKTINPIHSFSSFVAPKEMYLKVGGSDKTLKARQDVDLFYRLSKHLKFIAISEILVNLYNNVEGRISANYSNRLTGFQQYLEKHKQDLTFAQRSFLNKRIFILALKNKSFLTATKVFPASLYSIISNLL